MDFTDVKKLIPLKEIQRLEGEMLKEHNEFMQWVLPLLVPKIKEAVKLGWRLEPLVNGVWFYKGFSRVLITGSIETDGNKWLHLSISHHEKLPHYTTLVAVRKIFLGEDIPAIQVFPRKEEYVNDDKYTLHLWVNTSNPNFLPDFRKWDDRKRRLSI